MMKAIEKSRSWKHPEYDPENDPAYRMDSKETQKWHMPLLLDMMPEESTFMGGTAWGKALGEAWGKARSSLLEHPLQEPLMTRHC